jgi:hypothetical protein
MLSVIEVTPVGTVYDWFEPVCKKVVKPVKAPFTTAFAV